MLHCCKLLMFALLKLLSLSLVLIFEVSQIYTPHLHGQSEFLSCQDEPYSLYALDFHLLTEILFEK